MTRFLPYRFREQAGDELVFIDVVGGERRVPFRIVDVAPPEAVTPLFLAWPTAGAWVTYSSGTLRTIPAPTADNEIDALSRFLHALRRCGVVYDQTDQIVPPTSQASGQLGI